MKGVLQAAGFVPALYFQDPFHRFYFQHVIAQEGRMPAALARVGELRVWAFLAKGYIFAVHQGNGEEEGGEQRGRIEYLSLERLTVGYIITHDEAERAADILPRLSIRIQTHHHNEKGKCEEAGDGVAGRQRDSHVESGTHLL
jgi:hypothetical protein